MVTEKSTYGPWLGDVPRDNVFWCYGGRVVKNLEELSAALREMSEETFRYHVSGGKNDFSNWVRDVIGDRTLANQLKKAATRGAAARRVEARVGWLRARL